MKGCNKSHNFTSDEAYHTSDKDFTKDEAIHSSTPAAAKEDGRCNKQTTSVERTEDSWRERWGWASYLLLSEVAPRRASFSLHTCRTYIHSASHRPTYSHWLR
ncbi:uncharacterized protein LOC123503863 isoform X7 [Portunus trituberculatus]|uniref:uncharacterized protein LOC123503863 isoform X7 n=1 Tax=Portunus trituberculatus TaxID=210409 RepID=UPI001E1D1D15|nr:uncharacterized protein LOC123503863 isoform X7 [Portunus trituberculatus]